MCGQAGHMHVWKLKELFDQGSQHASPDELCLEP